MKLKFKQQGFQTDAVTAVADCFQGQPLSSGVSYRIDPGRTVETTGQIRMDQEVSGFKNNELALPLPEVLKNIHAVQQRQNLPLSSELKRASGCEINLDIEMETGTGKTYCYIKTMFELNKRYGWSKFIVVVPSIAIREGVHKSFESRLNTSWSSTASEHGSSSTIPSNFTTSKAFPRTPGSTR
jgi:type III restriction enzyme